jgi:fucose permease
LLAGSYGVGGTLGPALVALSGRWQLAYVVSTVVTFLTGAALLAPWLRWPDALTPSGGHGDPPQEGSAPRAPRAPRPPWAVVLVSLGLFAVFVGIEATAGQWTVTFLEQARGFERRLAGMAVSSFFAGVTIGRIGLGAVDVPRRVPLWVVSMPIPLFAAVALGPRVLIPVLMFMAGLSLAPTFPTLMAATADRVGAERAGQMSGWQVVASNAGATVFPALTGLFVDVTTPVAAMVILTLMTAAGVLLVLLAQGRPTLAAIRHR